MTTTLYQTTDVLRLVLSKLLVLAILQWSRTNVRDVETGLKLYLKSVMTETRLILTGAIQVVLLRQDFIVLL